MKEMLFYLIFVLLGIVYYYCHSLLPEFMQIEFAYLADIIYAFISAIISLIYIFFTKMCHINVYRISILKIVIHTASAILVSIFSMYFYAFFVAVVFTSDF